jgi:hypothetical protein
MYAAGFSKRNDACPVSFASAIRDLGSKSEINF